MSVWNVVNYLATRPTSFSTTQFTLGKGRMYAGNVGTCLLTDLFHCLRFHTESRPFEYGECGKPFRWRSVSPAVLESSHWIKALWMTAQVEDLAHWISENSHRKFRELTSMCGECASSVVLLTQQVIPYKGAIYLNLISYIRTATKFEVSERCVYIIHIYK